MHCVVEREISTTRAEHYCVVEAGIWWLSTQNVVCIKNFAEFRKRQIVEITRDVLKVKDIEKTLSHFSEYVLKIYVYDEKKKRCLSLILVLPYRRMKHMQCRNKLIVTFDENIVYTLYL